MRRTRGFTLLETLVTLIITALTVVLLFQVIGNFDQARRVAARFEAVQGNRDVMLAWFRDSVDGLVAVDPKSVPGTSNPHAPVFGLTGDAMSFTAETLAPLHRADGVPTRVTWRIVPSSDGGALEYVEAGLPALRLDLGTPLRRFVYVDHEGKLHHTWPPRLGLQEAMPSGIAIEAAGSDARTVIDAAIAVPQPLELPAYTNLDDGP